MKYKFFKLTCVCLMTLVFGMKLASATPILLTFDWTGKCDDCQGPDGEAMEVPGFRLGDGYTQDVTGVLMVYYDSGKSLGDQFEFKSFVYNGSSILYPVAASGYYYEDLSSAFTVLGSSVEVTGGMQFHAPVFTYKGNFRDAVVGDSDNFYGTGQEEVWRVTNYIKIDPINARGFDLFVYYETNILLEPVIIVRGGGRSNSRASGSRDVGYDSKFVMRGTLPSPLANPVPEPSTIALFALGVLGLSLRRKKCA